MILLIWKKELKEIFRTSKMVGTIAGISLLMLLALYNGYNYYTTHSRLLKESQETTYQQFITQGDKNPHLGAHFGFYAYKPTAGLALIDNGIEDYTGSSFYLEPHKRGIVRFREVSDQTGLRSFGFFNVGFFAQFMLPLFIFLICHNIFSKEWENGTIKMVLSSKTTTRQLFIGKLLGCLTLVFGVLMLLAVSALILLRVALPVDDLVDVLPSYGWFLLILTIYCLIMTIIGVSISLLTRNSALSLALLCGFWLMGVFLIPRLAAELSRRIYPSITSLEFEVTTFRQKQYGVNGEGTKDQRREVLKNEMLKKYGVSRLEDLPVFFIPITIEYFEDSDGLVMENAYSKVEANESRQDRFLLGMAWLSPFLAFRDFSMHMTATDMQTHQDFSDKAEIHRRAVGVLVNDFYQKNTVATNEFWKTVPQFSYTPMNTWERLSRATSSLLILLSWFGAALLLMRFSYRKMRI